MFTNRIRARKHKKRLKRKFLLISVLLVSILIAGSYAYYTIQYAKPLYISPLSGTTNNNSSSGEDENLALLKKLLQKKQIKYSQVVSVDTAYILYFENGSEAIFSKERDMELQISSLQYILSRLTMERRQFHKLDLRFDKPVIRE